MASIFDETCTEALPVKFYSNWSINEQCDECEHPLAQHRGDAGGCVQCAMNTRLRKLEEAVALLHG